jgi:hypothetical protein
MSELVARVWARKGGRMSDPAVETRAPMKWDEASDPDGLTKSDMRPRDWMLQSALEYLLGRLEEHEENSFSATFVVGGQVVSGLVIGRRAWMAEQEKALSQDGGAAEQLGIFMRTLFDEVIGRADESTRRRDEADLPRPATTFFHMKRAKVGQGAGAVTFPLWRGTLADVTGWSFGKTD